ncbi:Hypothetical predicted protein [Olea europaea subsp. europaea]|uniref:Uncharacterized protein n=1 Tax=Olea europaea subsp. europaea TaxID=158383 RepID=A0A8S0TYK3_OLEEU|nr:Hypothetical predicted protein [Olea europaea subsp. europaea]
MVMSVAVMLVVSNGRVWRRWKTKRKVWRRILIYILFDHVDQKGINMYILGTPNLWFVRHREGFHFESMETTLFMEV